MSAGFASAALIAAVLVFAVGEVVVLGQIFREARRHRAGAASWLTQTAWALVPLLMLGALLLAASRAEPALDGPDRALAAEAAEEPR